jgi:hypothetical protein
MNSFKCLCVLSVSTSPRLSVYTTQANPTLGLAHAVPQDNSNSMSPLFRRLKLLSQVGRTYDYVSLDNYLGISLRPDAWRLIGLMRS